MEHLRLRGHEPRRALDARKREHRLGALRWLVLLLLLVLGVHSVAAEEEPAPVQSFMPDARVSPPLIPWQLAGVDLATPVCDPFRLYLADERPAECGQAALASAASSESSADQRPTAQPQFEKQAPSKLWSYAIVAGVVAGALANTLSETPHQSFHFGNERWFGENTYAGGADKAAHFVQYYIISREMSLLYRTLGYTETQSIAIGAGLGLLAGIINETGDGINRYGFSYEDLVMDVSGTALAALVSGLGVSDVVGFRTGILLPPYSVSSAPGEVGGSYSSQIYTADLKLAGAARRLNLNIGPLRYLLFSVTYGSKGYATGIASLRERQVGFEIGLNLEEILNSVGVRRDTWWGYSLHFVLDNFRVPFTSVGFQYDLNAGKWYGPGNGNNYATR
jgi:hypothetical protein